MNVLLKSFFTLTILTALAACGGDGSSNGDTSGGSGNPTVPDADTIAENKLALDVYKSESCGCCGIWVDYMESKGYTMRVHHPQDLNAVKEQYGIDPQWQSCHTAVTEDGKVFEGHIPARFVKQFLDNPPAMAKGLAVAGMPLGSPGMEVGDRFTPYEVMLLKEDGTAEVYATLSTAADQF
jgi:hypothetical protein